MRKSDPMLSLFLPCEDAVRRWLCVVQKESLHWGVELASPLDLGFPSLPELWEMFVVVVVQLLSHVQLFAAPWTAACQPSLSITKSWSLPKLMSIESVIPSNHLILCHPLLLLLSIFPSIRLFSNEPVLHIRWPKYWNFIFRISLSNEYSGLISFRMDWFYHLAVQGTLKSLLQHHSSKASILQCSAFFIVQLSDPLWKTHSFCWQTDLCWQSSISPF